MKSKQVLGVVGALVICLTLQGAEVYGGVKWSLTIPFKTENSEERIESLRITVRDGWVYSISRFPKGWSIMIDDLGYQIVIDGYATHGVAMEYPEFFKDFIVFEEKDLPPDMKYSLDILVEIGLFVYTGPGSDITRKISLKKEELFLRRVTNVEVR